MNGESKIYEAITDMKVQLEGIQVRQEERHNENKQDMGVLFKKIDDINKDFGRLPCKAHSIMIKALFAIFGTGLLSTLVVVLIRKALLG